MKIVKNPNVGWERWVVENVIGKLLQDRNFSACPFVRPKIFLKSRHSPLAVVKRRVILHSDRLSPSPQNRPIPIKDPPCFTGQVLLLDPYHVALVDVETLLPFEQRVVAWQTQPAGHCLPCSHPPLPPRPWCCEGILCCIVLAAACWEKCSKAMMTTMVYNESAMCESASASHNNDRNNYYGNDNQRAWTMLIHQFTVNAKTVLLGYPTATRSQDCLIQYLRLGLCYQNSFNFVKPSQPTSRKLLPTEWIHPQRFSSEVIASTLSFPAGDACCLLCKKSWFLIIMLLKRLRTALLSTQQDIDSPIPIS